MPCCLRSELRSGPQLGESGVGGDFKPSPVSWIILHGINVFGEVTCVGRFTCWPAHVHVFVLCMHGCMYVLHVFTCTTNNVYTVIVQTCLNTSFVIRSPQSDFSWFRSQFLICHAGQAWRYSLLSSWRNTSFISCAVGCPFLSLQQLGLHEAACGYGKLSQHGPPNHLR